MADMSETLKHELRDEEYSEGYAESFLDAYIATQIKVLREQRELTQVGLASLLGTQQTVVSRIENVNYSSWNINTLKKIARALKVRLKVSFETYGSLIGEVTSFSRESLQRAPRDSDPVLYAPSETGVETESVEYFIPADIPLPPSAGNVVFIDQARNQAIARLRTTREEEVQRPFPPSRTSVLASALQPQGARNASIGNFAR